MVKAKSRLPFFDKLVLFANYFAAVALLISYLAPFTDPKTFWPVAFFGLAYPPLLLVNGLMIGYWLFRLKWQSLISIVCILIGWSVLLNNIGFHNTTQDEPKSNVDHIRMMEYNVHSFESPKSYTISTKKQILQVIKDAQPDIVNLEEFHAQSKSNPAMCDSIKKLLQTDNYFFQAFRDKPSDKLGLAIVSKFPIINHGVIWFNHDETDTKSIYVDVKIKEKTVRVYCVHFQSFLLNAEDHQYVDNAQEGKASIKSSRRIGGKLKAGFIRRSEQVKIMKGELAKCPYPYIVAGDFNDTPTSYAVNEMARGIKNAFREKGRGLGRTYNGDIPNYQIDYIMASPQFDVINYTVIEKKLSDHYPIRSDLWLK